MASTTLEQGIGVKLRATVAVTAYTSTRIYWLSAPDNATLPYIVYRVVSQENEGDEGGDAKDSTALVQFDIWSKDQYDALGISGALISTLEAYSGGFDGINVTRVTTNGPQQLRDPDFPTMFHFIIDADMTFYR